MKATVTQFSVGGFDKNFSYVIHDDGEAAVVDPSGSLLELRAFIKENKLKIRHILLTHSHEDHTEKLEEMCEAYQPTVYMHKSAEGHVQVPKSCEIVLMEHGELIQIGTTDVMVFHVPGHTDDSVCYYLDSSYTPDGIPRALTGDTLFVGGCGRTNEHNVRELYKSLMRLKTLPVNTIIYPGHDYGEMPYSTIAHEREHNKYLKAPTFEAFKNLRLG